MNKKTTKNKNYHRHKTLVDIYSRQKLLNSKQALDSENSLSISMFSIPQPPQPFYSPFSGTTQVSRCQKITSGLYDARED